MQCYFHLCVQAFSHTASGSINILPKSKNMRRGGCLRQGCELTASAPQRLKAQGKESVSIILGRLDFSSCKVSRGQGTRRGGTRRVLYPGPVLPSSVCCLLIHGDTQPSKALAGHKKKIILLHEAGTFPSGTAGLGKLGVPPWGMLVLRMLWLL